MDKLKELDNLCIRYLVEELKPLLIGSYINKIQEVEKGVFKFKLHTKEGSKNLIITPKCFYFTSYSFKAPIKPHGYSLFLRKRLENEKILDVRQHKWERIVTIETKNYIILLELFANGNIILLDKEFNILMPFRKEIWKDREIKKGVKYAFPKAEKMDAPFNAAKVEKCIKGKISFKELLSKLNVAPIYLEEAFKETIEKNKSIKELAKFLNEIYGMRKRKNVCIVEHKGIKLVPIKLKNFKILKEYEDLNSALDEYLSKEILQKEELETLSKKESKVKELKFNLEKILKREKELVGEIEKFKKSGEWLYLHYAEVQNLLKLTNELIRKKLSEKEILEILKEKFPFKIKKIDIKKKEIIVQAT